MYFLEGKQALMVMEIILIILQFVVVFLFFIFKNTAPNYLKKKDENLATLQDIGKITGEVKEVESKFSQKLAQFQTDLDLIIAILDNLKDKVFYLLLFPT